METGYYSDSKIKKRCISLVIIHILFAVSSVISGKIYGNDFSYMATFTSITFLGCVTAYGVYLLDRKIQSLLTAIAKKDECKTAVRMHMVHNAVITAVVCIDFYLYMYFINWEKGSVWKYGIGIYTILAISLVILAGCLTYMWFHLKTKRKL